MSGRGGLPIRRFSVLIADDHPLMGEMLGRLVRADDRLELVAACTDGLSAFSAIRASSPDLAVVDVAMPGLTGPELATALTEAGSPTRILFISGTTEPQTLYKCFSSGAHGFVSKTATKEAIVEAIVEVANGGTAFPREVAAALVAGREREGAGRTLSRQETRVLELSAEGRSIAETAAALFLGQTTVKSHLRNAATKLGVRGKSAAIAEAVRRGIIT